MFLYGIGRAIIEGFRTDSLYLFNFRISQVLAIIFAAVFGILLIKQRFSTKTKQNQWYKVFERLNYRDIFAKKHWQKQS